MSQQEFVGFSKMPAGHVCIIGIGPEDWLRERQHLGAVGFEMRPATAADYVEPPPERDLSGGSL